VIVRRFMMALFGRFGVPRSYTEIVAGTGPLNAAEIRLSDMLILLASAASRGRWDGE
jgi:hypothetical protein